MNKSKRMANLKRKKRQKKLKKRQKAIAIASGITPELAKPKAEKVEKVVPVEAHVEVEKKVSRKKRTKVKTSLAIKEVW